MNHSLDSLSTGVVAIYGGTFDPFHRAHAAICHSVLSHSSVAQLRIIPCFIPALKSEASVSARHRIAMLEQWRAGQPDEKRVCIDDQEIKREGASYTVDTVTNIAAELTGSKLVFVLGTDAWNSLPKWHRYSELKKAVSFWVFRRQGEEEIAAHCEYHLCKSTDELFSAPAGSYFIDDSVNLPLSSSGLRAGKQGSEQLPDQILNYINEHKLYRLAQ